MNAVITFLIATGMLAVVSLFPVIAVWWDSQQAPLVRKLALSAALVATNITLLFYVQHIVGRPTSCMNYRDNLKTYGELLENATPDDALTYTRLLKEEPTHWLKARAEEEKARAGK